MQFVICVICRLGHRLDSSPEARHAAADVHLRAASATGTESHAHQPARVALLPVHRRRLDRVRLHADLAQLACFLPRERRAAEARATRLRRDAQRVTATTSELRRFSRE